MKKNLFTTLMMCTFLAVGVVNAQQLAFPGAEGFGKYATGGRTGSVYHVTNLNDSGAGSFRDAVSQSNRIIVFDVAGVIRLTSGRIVVKNNIYIAGQTAPGEGITIYGNGLSFSGASNVICRYLRVRMGAVGDKDKDAITMENGSNMIFDHVSVAWGRDETFSITGSVDNITLQNSIVSQGLLAHSAGGLVEPSGNVTIYRSLYIHNDTRNPKFKGVHQFVNNIVYNWKSAAYIMGDSNSRSYANAVGNYFITGTAGSTTAFSGGNDKYSIYAEDNWVDKDRDGTLDGYLIPQSEYKGPPNFVSTPYDYPALPTIPAQSLYADLVKTVGASLPYRDNLDWNLINDLSSFGIEGSIISNENDLLIGNPDTWSLWAGNKRVDTDGDGIPDEWENAHSLNANDASDAMKIAANGYTNIENYINSITADNSQTFLKSPLCLQAASTTQNEIQLKWLDYTDHEDGYIIEEKIGNNFQEIARVGKDINTYTAQSLLPESTHIYRVKGYKTEPAMETAYTNELTVKTRPIPVNVTDPDTFSPDVTWAGSSGDWNTTTGSWADEKIFATGNKVLFNDAASNNVVTVNLTEAINQGTTMIKGDADYKFTGSAMGGEGSFNKTGKGTVTLGANNNYTGATVIWDGVLEISKLANGGQPSSIGASQNYNFNWVWNGGKISYTGVTVTTDRNVLLENTTEFEITNSAATVTIDGVVDGTGDFIKSGPGKFYSTFGKHTYTGNTIVQDGVYELRGNYAEVGLKGKLILEGGTFRTIGGSDGKDGIFSFPIEVRGDKLSYLEPTRNSQIKSKVSGTGNLQINVAYVREFYTGNWDEFYGDLTISGNECMWSTNIPNARVTLTNTGVKAGNNGLTMYIGALSSDATGYLHCSHVKTAGGTATWVVGGLNTDEEFKGVITSMVTHDSRKGRSNIVKEGTGYWKLSNTNKYLGTTTVNGGTLIVNGTHTTDKDWDANGVHSPVTPGAYTVNAEGTLAGKGNITTTGVTVRSGGTLAPGDGIGTLTINAATTLQAGSTLQVEVDRKNKKADLLKVVGKLTLAGDLNVVLDDGNYAAGDAMTILSATSYSGSFANIIPEIPAEGLAWDTSSLYTNGVLKVRDALSISSNQNPDLKIKSADGMIIIEGIQSSELVIVYDLSGTVIFNRQVNDSSTEIPVETGLYFVKVGNKTAKIIIR